MELVRGTTHTFTARFVDPGNVPLVPADPSSMPQVTLRDPDGAVVATGVGTASGSNDGVYRFQWFVPQDAALNTEDVPWNITWIFVTVFGHSAQHGDDFDVVDKIEATPEERQHTLLTREGGWIRAVIRVPTQVAQISLEIMGAEGSSQLHHIDAIATTADEEDPSNGNHLIVERAQDGQYTYYYDIVGWPIGEYHLYWTTLASEVSSPVTEVQVVRVAPNVFWHYNVELGTLIDKLHKRAGTAQAYSDSDMYSYVLGGLGIVNTISPSTTWLLTDIPLNFSRGIRTIIIYASAIYGLQAQQVLEIELNFDFGGQAVSLGYNHDFTGVLGSFNEMLNRFAEEKVRINRLANGAAFSGARPKDWRFTNHVWRLDQRTRAIVPPGGGAIWKNIGL